MIIHSYYLTLSIDNKNESQLLHESGLCSEEGIQILIITIASIVLLKYQYYIHHLIGLISFIILSGLIDFIYNRHLFQKHLIIIIILFLIFVSTESIEFCYIKYMMDKLYYSPYNIIFAYGLNTLVFNILNILIMVYNDGSIYMNNYLKLKDFVDYFKKDKII